MSSNVTSLLTFKTYLNDFFLAYLVCSCFVFLKLSQALRYDWKTNETLGFLLLSSAVGPFVIACMLVIVLFYFLVGDWGLVISYFDE